MYTGHTDRNFISFANGKNQGSPQDTDP